MGKKSREKETRRLENLGQQTAVLDLRSPLEKYAFLIIEFGVYLALLAPAIMLRDYFFPFIVPKTVYFRIMVDIIFIAYVFLAVNNPKYRPRLNLLTIAVSLFLLVSIFASIFGVNFQRSFWSVFERMTGLLTLIHLFIFFIILSSVFKERKYWERILASSIIVGIIVCFLGWTSTEASTRGGSTIGNTSFMAGYLLFNIFFAIILFFTKNFWWKLFAFASVIILGAGLLISIEPSRGAIGALLIGFFLLALVYLMNYLIRSDNNNLRRLGIIIPFILVLVVLLMLQFSFVKQTIADEWESTSIYSRRVIWQMAIEGWQERPWLGWGPENFNIPFVKYFDPQLPISGDIWYDRTHNIIFDTAVASGLIGLISYLSIFGAAFWGLMRIIPQIQEKRNLLFPMGMIAVLSSYFIQNLFVFDMISSYMMFFLSLAFVAFLAFPEKEEQEQIAHKPAGLISSFAAALLIAIAILTIYFGNMLPAQASRYTIRGLVLPTEESLGYFQKALKISPISQFEVPEQLALRSMELARQPVKDINALKEQMNRADETLKKAIAHDPLNYRTRLFLGRYYNNLYEIFGDEEKLIISEQTLREAISYSPKNQQTYWTLGQIRLFQSNREEAIEFFQKAVDLEPRLGVSHWYLAMGYRIAGKYEQAAAEIKEAEKFNYNFTGNIDDLKKAIDVYIGLDDKAAMAPLLEKMVELDPKNTESWARLADMYAFFDRKEQAKTAALKVLSLDPARTEQIKEFLNALGFDGELEIANFNKESVANNAKYVVVMQNLTLNPNMLRVPIGATVTWLNKDIASHNIQMEAANSSTLETGDKFEYTFKQKGEFWYICSLHSYMKGRIIVE